GHGFVHQWPASAQCQILSWLVSRLCQSTSDTPSPSKSLTGIDGSKGSHPYSTITPEFSAAAISAHPSPSRSPTASECCLLRQPYSMWLPNPGRSCRNWLCRPIPPSPSTLRALKV